MTTRIRLNLGNVAAVQGHGAVLFDATSAAGDRWFVKVARRAIPSPENLAGREILGARIATACEMGTPDVRLAELDRPPIHVDALPSPTNLYVASERLDAPARVQSWKELSPDDRVKLVVFGAITASGAERFDSMSGQPRDVYRVRRAGGPEVVVLDFESINAGRPIPPLASATLPPEFAMIDALDSIRRSEADVVIETLMMALERDLDAWCDDASAVGLNLDRSALRAALNANCETIGNALQQRLRS